MRVGPGHGQGPPDCVHDVRLGQLASRQVDRDVSLEALPVPGGRLPAG